MLNLQHHAQVKPFIKGLILLKNTYHKFDLYSDELNFILIHKPKIR